MHIFLSVLLSAYVWLLATPKNSGAREERDLRKYLILSKKIKIWEWSWMNRCGSRNILTNRIRQMKCTFVHAVVQSIVIGWVQGLILDMCEPVEFLNMYYQKLYSSYVMFMWNICATNVIIHVCLSISQLVSSLPAVVHVSLPRLVSTAAGAVNSKGREKNFSFLFFFLCGYAAVLKGYQKPFAYTLFSIKGCYIWVYIYALTWT